MKAKTLSVLKRKPDEALVKHLQELVRLAETGELVSLTYFGECTELQTVHGTAGPINRALHVMACERAKLSLLDVMVSDEWVWTVK